MRRAPQARFVDLGGARSCPPRTVADRMATRILAGNHLRITRHPEYEDKKEWLGEGFDPEYFDLESINRRLRRLKVGGIGPRYHDHVTPSSRLTPIAIICPALLALGRTLQLPGTDRYPQHQASCAQRYLQQGSLHDGLYRNPSFGFSYKIPYGWVDRTDRMRDDSKDPSQGLVLLAVFERPPEVEDSTINSGLLIAAESVSSYPGLKTAADYFGPLEEVTAAKGLKIIDEPYAVRRRRQASGARRFQQRNRAVDRAPDHPGHAAEGVRRVIHLHRRQRRRGAEVIGRTEFQRPAEGLPALFRNAFFPAQEVGLPIPGNASKISSYRASFGRENPLFLCYNLYYLPRP